MLITKKIQYILYKLHNILLSYSGGLDSSVLLYDLVQLRKKYPSITIRAIHINHNLNYISKTWINKCFLTCKKLHVDFIYKNIFIYKKSNIEEEARIKRYKILNNLIKADEYLVTAHHLDDQCETILLALKRGSGLKGLSGIAEQNNIKKMKIFRPLLYISKKKILWYALQHNITWIDDPSNIDNRYDRNFLRNIILPQINIRWPFFRKTIIRSAKICQEQETLLNEFLNPILNNLIQENKSIFFIPLKFYSVYKRYAILRKWLEYNKCHMVTYKTLSLIWNEVICAQKLTSKIIIHKKIICKNNTYLFCLNYIPTLQKIILFWYDIKHALILPYKLGTLCIVKKDITNSIVVRYPYENENIYVKFYDNQKIYFCQNNFKKININHIWNKLSIPIYKRNQIPLLFYNNCLIADLENNLITIHGKVMPNNQSLYITWIKIE
ncbi:tRNA lysidine(34) synthetase TilS [Enterobacteriaceae endosymbiont of Macroplea appendiculata]|uniref:tRNA lysidine(34) synthetase TilS n=1 Tax=Enterobacteriaceae endosymbiont of Macroplea appendiculata TaxID=2675790 RepID=UPI001449C7F6|nr:tRNA lysidine(34) synthetase TilS [Enterobacteriaceae endosymbiont of Macroplea appendiculata]QJC30836.1 tRNA lysidine(34) synthetase TilS [Enterobacteriaceae endosymbiont of Macroplea appendiculata]